MKIQLKHHYGWETYDVEATNRCQAAYLAVREAHKFLADDNHNYEVHPNSKFEWGGKKCQFNSVYILRNDKSPKYSGPAIFAAYHEKIWFTVEYK